MDLDPGGVFPAHALPMFLVTFALSAFAEATEFDFTLVGVHHPVPLFTAFTACLPAITTIPTDKLSVRHITHAVPATPHTAYPSATHPFPALTTVVLDTSFPPAPTSLRTSCRSLS